MYQTRLIDTTQEWDLSEVYSTATEFLLNQRQNNNTEG
jgi:hypothetical protein